ncbi:MAG: putative DNA binding domain-containing protein [Chloroflexi bacterium]|nr:putative DNA binding domain-containing protein [Chloroflexota bacterium]
MDVWETVSAFANTNGGTLLLGIAERGGRFEIAGLVDAAKIQHALVSGLRETLNVPIAAQVEPLVVNTDDAERVILSAYIPEAIAYQKPVYIRGQGLDKGCYRRVGEHDMPCTEDDLARFFQDRALISPDMLPVPMVQRAELDAGQVRAFRQLVATQNPANSVLGYDDDDLLRAYGALSQPKGETGWAPTVAGVLMFGTPALIQRCFPAFRVDLIEVEGTEWVTAPTERGAGRSFQGPLLEVTRELLRVLRQEIPNALRSGQAKRNAWLIRCTWRCGKRSTTP